MSPYKLHLLFMGIIQDEVSIRSASRILVVHSQHIKDLISNFEYAQQDIISKNQKNIIKNINHHQISWW